MKKRIKIWCGLLLVSGLVIIGTVAICKKEAATEYSEDSYSYEENVLGNEMSIDMEDYVPEEKQENEPS